jgi:hypothetical protein
MFARLIPHSMRLAMIKLYTQQTVQMIAQSAMPALIVVLKALLRKDKTQAFETNEHR